MEENLTQTKDELNQTEGNLEQTKEIELSESEEMKEGDLQQECISAEVFPGLKTKEQIRQEKKLLRKQNRELKKTPEYQRAKIDRLLSKQGIKYRGPFSYRAVRIFAYIFMFFAQVVLVYSILSSMLSSPSWVGSLMEVLDALSLFALPLFLTANFCVIMFAKKGIKNFLIFYTAFAILIYLTLVLISYRYIGGFARVIAEDAEEAAMLTESITRMFFGKVINYNVFVDLSLFSFFYFFFFYTPKNIKTKRGMIIFRYLSLIPVLIVVASALLYGFYYLEYINLPVAALAIMPCRSLSIYLIFFILSVLIKLRKYKFLKMGGTEEEYEQYTNSNRSSLEVSVLASILILVVSVVEFITFAIFPQLLLFGIGGEFYFVFIIPFIFLLSYTRKPKFKIVDTLMPLVFVIFTIVLYLEAILIFFQNI